jgi:hypothetical protein
MSKPPPQRPDRILLPGFPGFPTDEERKESARHYFWYQVVEFGPLFLVLVLLSVATVWAVLVAWAELQEKQKAEAQPMELLALRVQMLGLEVKALKAETKLLLQDATRLQQAAGLPVEDTNEPKR